MRAHFNALGGEPSFVWGRVKTRLSGGGVPGPWSLVLPLTLAHAVPVGTLQAPSRAC